MTTDTTEYEALLERKRHAYADAGFEATFMPPQLFDFQQALVRWAVKKGRAGIFASCGLGKSAMEATWAQNVVEKTNRPVLILTPLAVSAQMVHEAAKFGVESVRSSDGKYPADAKIVVTNYERLHYFNQDDFAGVVCDESSALKNCDGVTRAAVTNFMRKMSFRLLCTATPSPNDLIELGTSSEALGYMGFNDMLTTFFKKDEDRRTNSRKDEFRSGVWRFRGHAEKHFFHWVCSWARAARKPSDLGFCDDRFKLPELVTRETVVECHEPLDGMLFNMPAVGLAEQRKERRRTLDLRCEAAADRINDHPGASLAWCYLNDEGKQLNALVPNSVEVAGCHTTEFKEDAIAWFVDEMSNKELNERYPWVKLTNTTAKRTLISKPDIFGFGLNLQNCAHQTFFPSHSFEQFHQAIRRSWRFGQTQSVLVDIITSEGERGVLANLMRKADQAELLFANLVSLMGEANTFRTESRSNLKTNLPQWL